MNKDRIEWVDILKFLGILAIFCGHLGNDTGNLHDFVFYYHVPLFFFASGLFADRMKDLSLWETVKKKAYQILLPYLFLIIINMIVLVLLDEADFITYIKYVKQFIWGIRNQMPAASLWFFSCLFCVAVLFDFLRRILKRKSLLFLASLLFYLIAVMLFPNRPDITPSWFFNIDSACYYLIYYTVGYIAKEALFKEPTKGQSWWIKWAGLFGIGTVFVYIYTAYMKKDFLGELFALVPFMGGLFYPIIRAMIIITGNIIVAKTLTGSKKLSYIGTQTLWLCGNEAIAKHIMNALAGILGFTVEIKGALTAIVYGSILILFIIYVLMPIEKKTYDYCINVGLSGQRDGNS